GGDHVGAKLEPIGEALVELAVATWTFTKYLFEHQIQDSKTHIVEPLQQKLNSALAENNEETTVTTRTDEDTTKKSFLLENRVIRLSIVGWILSEALDLLGILNEDTPRLLKSQVDRVWYDVQPRLLGALERMQEWWSMTMSIEKLESIPSKYNFAVGTSIGMIAAPFLSSLLGSIATPVILIYTLAEGNAFLQRQERRGIVEFLDTIHNGIGRVVGNLLERFRKMVRSAMSHSHPIEGALIKTTGGSHFSIHKGTMVYTYQRTLLSFLFPWIKRPIIKAVATSSKRTLHPMVAMIRHGFMVGSAIGFFLRT
ncbi:MAG: hypothetical protein SGBAC_012579, partial [Bacillariaceae sp.]